MRCTRITNGVRCMNKARKPYDLCDVHMQADIEKRSEGISHQEEVSMKTIDRTRPMTFKEIIIELERIDKNCKSEQYSISDAHDLIILSEKLHRHAVEIWERNMKNLDWR